MHLGQRLLTAAQDGHSQSPQWALACKKCTQYSQMFTDAQLKNMCEQLSCHHKQRFDTLYSFLESNK